MVLARKEGADWQCVLADQPGDDARLALSGRIDVNTAPALLRDAARLLKQRRQRPKIIVDLGGVTFCDDYGVMVLAELRQQAKERSQSFALAGVSGAVAETLALTGFDQAAAKSDRPKGEAAGRIVQLGEATIRSAARVRYLVSFLGWVCLAICHLIRHPRALRTEDTMSYMQKTGVEALPIVGLISFLLGLIMAFMSAVQLEQFGANIYVASLVGLAMTRELGPIMTAIIVAGRSGSAFAAEIGSMKISDEVDALTTMGFDPVMFLVMPKIVATVAVVPILTIFSDLLAMLGGLVVGVFMLDLTANSYIAQTIRTLTLFDLFLGVLKSGFFALLVSWIGCLRGFQVQGSAASVGQATTSAVVSGIFLIIVCNSLFSVILRYWG